jgi:hypothetical protein
MNNARYLDWVQDLLPSEFHREHPVKELTMCYINEALEAQHLELTWDWGEEGILLADIHRSKGDPAEDYDRIFSTKIKYE